MNVVELKDIRGRGRKIVQRLSAPSNDRSREALGRVAAVATMHGMTQGSTPPRSLGRATVQAAAQWLRPLKLARFPWVRRAYAAIYRRSVPAGELREVGLRGSRFLVDPHDGGVGYQLFIGRGYEELTADVFESCLRPGMRVLDLGANIGFYSVIAAARIGREGRVIAFEPAPENIAILERNAQINGFGQLQVVGKACSDKAERLTLRLNPRGKGLHTIGEAGADWGRLEIDTLVLDEYFADEQFQVDFLKIDIEGAEERALRGMRRPLSRSASVQVLTEVNPTALIANGSTPRSYLDQWRELGFEPRTVIDEAAARVLTPTREELLALCERRPLEVKHWNCNVLLSRP
jgi:FkbM family methyltransferase